MLEILYFIFIYPLFNIIQIIFFRIYDNCHYQLGISIILFVLLLNIFLAKLHSWASKKSSAFLAKKEFIDKKIKEFKRVFRGMELFAYTRILYKQYHYHPIFTIFSAGSILIQIPFFICFVLILKSGDIGLLNTFLWIENLFWPDFWLLNLMFALLILNAFLSLNIMRTRILAIILAIIFYALLFKAPSAIVLYWVVNILLLLFLNIKNRFKFAFGERWRGYLDSIFIKDSNKNLIFAIINICFLICIFTPLELYAKDINLAQNRVALISALIGYCFIFSLIFIYISNLFRLKYIYGICCFIICSILALGLIYSFILKGDYGAMDYFILQTPDFSSVGRFSFFTAIIFSLIIGYIFYKKIAVLKILFAVLMLVNAINIYKIYSFEVKKAADSSEFPLQNELLNYSTKENIVVFVLDMFSGSHTPYILEQFSQLKNNLDGFILFPNTLSTTNSTIHSIASVIGGEFYSAYNMNKRRDDLEAQIAQSFTTMGDFFSAQGFDVSMFIQAPISIKDSIKNNAKSDFFIEEEADFVPSFVRHSGVLENKNSDSVIVNFISFGLFRFVPEQLKKGIYNNGKYLSDKNRFWRTNNSVGIRHSSSFYAFSHFNIVKNDKPTFKFLHSLMTHAPYNIYFDGKTCDFSKKFSAWNDTLKNAVMNGDSNDKAAFYQHYDTEACALFYLSNFISWLKENNIYDNTKIIVVSDHGGNDGIKIKAHRADSLLFFKDFNARGNLKIDTRLMANYDAASLFCANFNCPNIPKNILQHYPTNRTLIHLIPKSWMIEKHEKNRWLIKDAYTIQNDIFEPKNWIRAEEFINYYGQIED